jgi:hypothetical protein
MVELPFRCKREFPTEKCLLDLLRSVLQSFITNAGEDLGKKEFLHSIGGNVNYFNCYRKQYDDFSNN